MDENLVDLRMTSIRKLSDGLRGHKTKTSYNRDKYGAILKGVVPILTCAV